MSKRSELCWRSFATAAAFVYLVAIFAPWSSVCYRRKGWPAALETTVTSACGAWRTQLGIASLVLCYLILVYALLGPRRSALSLAPLRTTLAFALLAITVLHILEDLRSYSPPLFGAYKGLGSLGFGAWAALGSSLALLLAVRTLDSGGLSELIDHLPAWARIDRLENPESEREARHDGDLVAPLGYLLWTAILFLALIVYLYSLFTPWWLAVGFYGLGGFCALVAVATLIVAFLARSGFERELGLARGGLVLSLACLTVLNLLEFKHSAWGSLNPFHHAAGPSPEYGTYIALGSLAVMIVSALVLNAGGRTATTDRRPVSAQLDRHRESQEESEKTT